jgi:hypothetical protein
MFSITAESGTASKILKDPPVDSLPPPTEKRPIRCSPIPHPLIPIPYLPSPKKGFREKLAPKNLVFLEKITIPLPRDSATPRNPRGKYHSALWKNSQKAQKQALFALDEKPGNRRTERMKFH